SGAIPLPDLPRIVADPVAVLVELRLANDGVEPAVTVEVEDRVALRGDGDTGTKARVATRRFQRNRLVLDDRLAREHAVAFVLVDEPRVQALAPLVGMAKCGDRR